MIQSACMAQILEEALDLLVQVQTPMEVARPAVYTSQMEVGMDLTSIIMLHLHNSQPGHLTINLLIQLLILFHTLLRILITIRIEQLLQAIHKCRQDRIPWWLYNQLQLTRILPQFCLKLKTKTFILEVVLFLI